MSLINTLLIIFVLIPGGAFVLIRFYNKLLSDFSPDEKKRNLGEKYMKDTQNVMDSYFNWLFRISWIIIKYGVLIVGGILFIYYILTILHIVNRFS
jgi:hypothetical protein